MAAHNKIKAILLFKTCSILILLIFKDLMADSIGS